MIESIEFKNFKSLRDTTLPLGPCTILVGPNGSGKSTVLQALEAIRGSTKVQFNEIVSFAAKSASDEDEFVQVKFSWPAGYAWGKRWQKMAKKKDCEQFEESPEKLTSKELEKHKPSVGKIRVFSLDPVEIAKSVPIQGVVELAGDGSGLAAVLDGMRDDAPEQFREIEHQIGQWLPEFDYILFSRPQQGYKSISLRTKKGHHKVPAADLSQGTLVSLALLTLAYHPKPPSLIALEEPDRGMHPYLLRNLKDILIRLSCPESCGEKRKPVQVIVTTHSPYFLDLFRETPEYVVVSNKVGLDVQFQRLTDQPQLSDILGDGALGDAWYNGVLGGVPSGS